MEEETVIGLTFATWPQQPILWYGELHGI
jgi:hypothetical protein